MLKRFATFSYVISSIYRDIQKIEHNEMEKLGYRGAYAQYLIVINDYEEGITCAKLCELCDKNKAAVSRIINEMEENKLIYRETKSNNKYNALLKLTDKGKQVASYVCDKVECAMAIVGEELDNNQRLEFYTSLDKINKRLQTLSKTGISE